MFSKVRHALKLRFMETKLVNGASPSGERFVSTRCAAWCSTWVTPIKARGTRDESRRAVTTGLLCLAPKQLKEAATWRVPGRDRGGVQARDPPGLEGLAEGGRRRRFHRGQ